MRTPISKHLRDAFRDVMRGKAYGQGPTMQAWHFFYCGWFKAGGATHIVNG